MCASKTTGYQGFRSFAQQECPTLKTGETYASRATKFSTMGSRIVTPPEINRLGRHAHESMGMQSTQLVQPSDYHVPDKRGVMAHEKRIEPKPFIATSMYQQDFTDFEDQMRAVVQMPIECYARAFKAFASIDARRDNNNGGEPTIELQQVPLVLRRVFENPPTRVIEIFVTLLGRKSSAAKEAPSRDDITWSSFLAVVQHVHSTFEHELDVFVQHVKRTEPFSGANSDSAIRVIPATTPASSYRIDYGANGDQPLERPYMRKRGMATTTTDLTPGTSQNTFHIPGYGGFLPRTTHNPHALAQADGALLRSRQSDLRLFHSDNVPGYTGHKPVDCSNYRGECRAGSDPNTTTGAGYHPHF